MSRTVTCQQCERTLPVGDSFQGDRIRCGGCQSIVQIAESETPKQHAATPAAEPVPIAATPKAPPAPAKITVVCTCGAKIPLDTSVRGKRVRCSTCSQLVHVPLANSATSNDAFGNMNFPAAPSLGPGTQATGPGIAAPGLTATAPSAYRPPAASTSAPESNGKLLAVLVGCFVCLAMFVGGVVAYQIMRKQSGEQVAASDPETSQELSGLDPNRYISDESVQVVANETEGEPEISAYEEDERRRPSAAGPPRQQQVGAMDTERDARSVSSNEAREKMMDPFTPTSSGSRQAQVESMQPPKGMEPEDSRKSMDPRMRGSSESDNPEMRVKQFQPEDERRQRMNSSNSGGQQQKDDRMLRAGDPSDSRSRRESVSNRGSSNQPRSGMDESTTMRVHIPKGYSIALPRVFNRFETSTHLSSTTYSLMSPSGLAVTFSVTDDGKITPNSPSRISPGARTVANGKLQITPIALASDPSELQVAELDGMRARFATVVADLSHGDQHEMVNQLFSGAIPSDVKHQLRGKLDAKVAFQASCNMEVMDVKRILHISISQTSGEQVSPNPEWLNWLKTLRHEADPDLGRMPPEFRARK